MLYMSAIPIIRCPPVMCLTGPTTSCPRSSLELCLVGRHFRVWYAIGAGHTSADTPHKTGLCLFGFSYNASFSSFAFLVHASLLSQQTTHTFRPHLRAPGALPIQIANLSIRCVACIFSRRCSQVAPQVHWHSYSRVPRRLGAVGEAGGR